MPTAADFDPAAALAAWARWLPAALGDPNSPFWWPTLLVAGLVAAAGAALAGVAWRDIPRRLFPHRRREALRELPVDLACWLAGSTLPFLLGPALFLVGWAGAAAGMIALLPLTGPPAAEAPLPGAPLLLLAALLAFALGDLALYGTHRLFHRVPLLWRAHRLHHAPAVLTPLTAFRFWPHETLVHMAGNLFGQGLGLGIVSALAGVRVPALAVLGVNVAALAWGLGFAHLRHSHVPIAFPRWLSFVLVSPQMHQAHHSADPAHHGRNYATALAVWDWLFGTLHVPAREERYRFGLGERAGAVSQAPRVGAAKPEI